MRFSITDEQVNGTTWVVRPRGEIDLAVAGELREHMMRLLDTGAKFLVIDLGGVRFLDSTGLTALMTAQRRAEELDGGVVVARAGEHVADVFQITGLDAVFGLHESVEAALAD
jgi:anti-sigma B factor antagonist